MITVENLHVSYDTSVILNDLSFSIGSGERVSIVGPGGSGKTTIFKAICGLIEDHQGMTQVFGREIAFQQGGLFDFMTVKENLEFAMTNMTNKSPSEQQTKIEELLAAVKLVRTKDMFPFELSGGMQRRVGLARAMCTDPELALFDEPTAGLDPVTSTIILNMIGDMGAKRDKSTLVIATSNVEIAFRFSRRVILINEGRVHADGDWADLLMQGDEWTRYFLGVRFKGLSKDYLHGMHLPEKFIETNGV
jgi:phospholipid/cholesterol/gamma-HCH transport system ATP-binding protein